MGATSNVLNSSLVNAQPRAGLARAKSWYLAQKRFRACLLRRVESQICSPQVESRGLLNLTKERLYRESGHRPPYWHESRESCGTGLRLIDGSGFPTGFDETSEKR